MQEIVVKGLDSINKNLQQLLKKLPEQKRELHEKLGEMAKRELDSLIGGSGRVASWQEKHVGSKGGYAAVRARGGYIPGEKYAYGHVTNAIENGHRQTPGRFIPYGSKGGYRLKRARVRGQHFYRQANSTAMAKAEQAIGEFAELLARQIGDGK